MGNEKKEENFRKNSIRQLAGKFASSGYYRIGKE